MDSFCWFFSLFVWINEFLKIFGISVYHLFQKFFQFFFSSFKNSNSTESMEFFKLNSSNFPLTKNSGSKVSRFFSSSLSGGTTCVACVFFVAPSSDSCLCSKLAVVAFVVPRILAISSLYGIGDSWSCECVRPGICWSDSKNLAGLNWIWKKNQGWK